jgi:hypothetical protein
VFNRTLSPVSPDGRFIAAATDGGITLVPLEGGTRRALDGAGASERPIQWSPTGQSLFVFDPSTLPAKLSEIELEGGRRRVVREITPADRTSVPGVTTALITPDGAFYVYAFMRFRTDLYLLTGLR